MVTIKLTTEQYQLLQQIMGLDEVDDMQLDCMEVAPNDLTWSWVNLTALRKAIAEAV
jgi:hypothetical protein